MPKKWRYTGKVYEVEDFGWIYFPIGCEKGYGRLEDEWDKDEGKTTHFVIQPDGRLAEIEEAEWAWVEEVG